LPAPGVERCSCPSRSPGAIRRKTRR
jgi:hypothetical protein